MRQAEAKISQGNAAQLLVAAELNRRGYCASVTLGNTPYVDVLCAGYDCREFAFVQVKSFRIKDGACTVGRHSICKYTEKFVWILVGFGLTDDVKDIEFYVVPSDVMTKEMSPRISKWERGRSRDGKSRQRKAVPKVRIDGKVRQYEYDVREWKDRWDVLKTAMKAK